MKIVALFSNIRDYENISPVLKALSDDHQIDLIYTPNLNDPSSKDYKRFDFNLELVFNLENLEFNNLILDEMLGKVKNLLSKADLLLLANVQNFPGADLYRHAKKINRKLKVIGFQHGLYQVWRRDHFRKIVDFYFAFGRGSRNFFPFLRRRDLVFCGIPKLDLISRVKPAEERFILFIGQMAPLPEVIDPFLEKVEDFYKIPVVVRNHPQYPGHYKFKSSFALEDPPSDLWQQISQAKFVIATHSTCLVDALLLRKNVVLLPNHGLSQLSGFEPIAKDFTVEALEVALSKARNWNYNAWLKNRITTLDFNSTTIAVRSISAIMGNPSFGYWHLYFKSKLSGLFYLWSWLERIISWGFSRKH